MGERPKKPFKPLKYDGSYEQVVRSIDLITALFKQAVANDMWLFDPASKRWFNPDEFMDMYDRYDNLDVKWIKNIEVRDPYEGLDAADQQVQSIMGRRSIFEKRIIEYYRTRSTKKA
jgi:hypothetical protein